MKYRYLIVDEWSAVWGTDNLKDAKTAAKEGCIVVDVKTSEVVDEDDGRESIDSYEPPEEEPVTEEEDDNG